jgi:hypothetical protein
MVWNGSTETGIILLACGGGMAGMGMLVVWVSQRSSFFNKPQSDKLRELAKLKDQGIITSEEFEKRRSEILREGPSRQT